eukprot:TRINITY_DN81543_c0_g1_i1.p1 TRINITY_DN81543_c0_g1~~TRINITY_DN81543_c0_g1_i1.p1  ORF type:complete len:201 (+),score=21.77 TRINITY_DN81543_c0_g1_i1:74-676(+)
MPRSAAVAFALTGFWVLVDAHCDDGIADGAGGCCSGTQKCPACCFTESDRKQQYAWSNTSKSWISQWNCTCGGCGQEVPFVLNASLTSQSACVDFLQSRGDVVVENTIGQNLVVCQACFGQENFAFHPSWVSKCGTMFARYVPHGFRLDVARSRAVCMNEPNITNATFAMTLSSSALHFSHATLRCLGLASIAAVCGLQW